MKKNRIDNEIKHGKKISKNAEEVWGWTSPAGQIRANRRANYFISEGRIQSNHFILEIGCGTGLFTHKVYEQTKANIVAIDLSEDLLEIAKRRNIPVVFKVENAMSLSLSDNTFDVVFGSSVIHHLEFDQVLSEIYRVLKPGGRMVFAEPNMINPQIFIQKNIGFIKEWLGDSPDETAIVRWSFKKKLRNHGFVDINIFPYDFLHPITPKPLIPMVNTIGKWIEKIPVLKEIAGSVIISAQKPLNKNKI